MPIISLLTPNAVADAAHQVTAPGGYEQWYFDAEDSAGLLRMVAVFSQGPSFHPGYVREYNRYRRWPTRNVPPFPQQFPCVYFALYHGDEVVGQFIAQLPAASFSASSSAMDVSIASNRAVSKEDGSLELTLNGVPWATSNRGPVILESQRLSATFTFKPRVTHEPMERRSMSRSWSKADHYWVVANPLCDATGQIELVDSATGKATQISINGLGYHDHNYGTGPIGPRLKRCMRGRMLLEDQAVTFQMAQPKDAHQADDVLMFEADLFGVRELPVDRFNADWSLKTRTLLRYPAWVEAGAMQLVMPRMIAATPFSIRLVYEASIRGAKGDAFCEIAYPHRLGWPILGKKMEKAIVISK